MYKRVTEAFYKSQLLMCLLLFINYACAMDYEPTAPSIATQPLIQIDRSKNATSSLLDISTSPQNTELKLGDLLLPLTDITFTVTPSVCTATRRGVEISVEGQNCFAKIPFYDKYIAVHPHETINPDGSRVVRDGAMIPYDNNTLLVGSDYILSQCGLAASVVITPLSAAYEPMTGGMVTIGQVPCNYLIARGCHITHISGIKTMPFPITKVNLSGNYLTSWRDIQVNLLVHLPQLKTLILDNNPLYGSCVLDHEQLKTLQASHTNTVSYCLKLPAAETIDLSYAQIMQCDSSNIKCAPGACINLSNNPIARINKVTDINKRKLQFDLRKTALSIEDVRKLLTPTLRVRSIINPYVYNAAEFVRIGALHFALLTCFSAASNGMMHRCRGVHQTNCMLLTGILPAALMTAGSISLVQKWIGVATTPRTITCTDGCLYASGTIEKTGEQQAKTWALPWFGAFNQLAIKQ